MCDKNNRLLAIGIRNQNEETFIFFCLQVVKLHTKLGKPIPSTEPVVVTSSGSSTTTTTSKAGTSKTTVTSTVKPVASSILATKRVLSTPKITFVGKFIPSPRHSKSRLSPSTDPFSLSCVQEEPS